MSGRPNRGIPDWLAATAPGGIHVVGASGAEGTALLRQLAGVWGLEGVVAHDFSSDTRAFVRSIRKANPAGCKEEREALVKEVLRLPIDFRLGSHYLEGLEAAGVIFASQNWFNYDSNLPAIPDAVSAGARLAGVIDLAMELFSGTRIGVTGSNGKSTTAALIRHLLSGCPGPWTQVLQGGNDRAQQVRLSSLEDASTEDLLVWEISNRHLRDRGVETDVAVLTNVTPNHIDDHGSWEAYVAAKRRLPTGARGHAVLSGQDPVSVEMAEELQQGGPTLWRFGASPGTVPGQGFVWCDGRRLRGQTPGATEILDFGPADAFPLPGPHNALNLQAALCVGLALGAEAAALHAALSSFAPLPGRLEEVARDGGRRWIYDIQATTAPAAEAGIRALGAEGTSEALILLVGGEDKGMDYHGMADAAGSLVERVVALPGSGTEAFIAALDGRTPVDRLDSLDDAIEHAERIAGPRSTVLLSPGCAFFFSRYIEGGPSFRQRVRRHLGLDAE